ncbi:MAG: Rne/Rng family ribonuclease [Clostridia bacterium]|nr:Rne/Rng family ribonuclease [Clostridia bacterium]MBQ9482002.1 Rne/Rng family ribonuclease [Clostridia bacterium]
MAKNIFLDINVGNYMAALADGEKLLEYHIEREDNSNLVGNIYKGKVVAVLGGMQAAFVNLGLKKNAYLCVTEMLPDKRDLSVGELPDRSIELKENDEILVQIVKDYMGTKGVKCSPHLSFAGVYLVYMPNFDLVGVSRKITDEKAREKLFETAEGIRKKIKGGFVVRTAAAKASRRDIKKEAEALYEKYLNMLKEAETAEAPALVYEEADLLSRMLRDVYSSEVANIYVGNRDLYDELCSRAREDSRGLVEYRRKAVLFDKGTDMFTHFGLDKEVSKLLRNRVELESGAYLIIDKTEALTVIDVNTGKYTGESNLEETVFNTNMLAAAEIARQVRLRNIGGIVVVDFIDMERQEHRDEVVKALENALKQDRSKCNVLGMSALGLVEFTRKKNRKESTSTLVQECPYCHGDGRIFSNDYVVLRIRAALLDLFAEGYKSAVIDLNVELADYILKKGVLSSDVSKIWKDKRIYIVPHKTYHVENFRARGDNSKVLDLPDKARLLF